MTTINKIILGLMAVVLVVAGFALGHSSTGSQALGAVTNQVNHATYGVEWFVNTVYFGTEQQSKVSSAGALTLSQSGTAVTGLNFGTCYLNFGNSPVSITASTTVNVDCQATNMLASSTIAQSALTGVTTNDNVSLIMPTTTPTTFLGLRVVGVNASSTPGYITAKLFNGTGAAITPGTTTVSGVQYRAFR